MRLYNASGTVLASAKVTTTDPKEGSPIMFFSAKLSKPLVLAAMTTYFIAEDLGTATTANGNVSGLTTSSAIKYDGEVAARGQGRNPTTDATGGVFSPDFWPQFRRDTGGLGGAGAIDLGDDAARLRRNRIRRLSCLAQEHPDARVSRTI